MNNKLNKKLSNTDDINDNDDVDVIDDNINVCDDYVEESCVEEEITMSDFDEDEITENVDIIDDTKICDNNIDEFELLYKLNTNKHKQDDKHKLKRDTLFKGKEEKKEKDDSYIIKDQSIEEENDYNDIVNFFNYESENYDDYIEQSNLTKDVHNVLSEKTDINFTQNRRKPNKETFNKYYNILLKELGFQYTKSEIFVELSYYFTDNIFNMFKLLDKVPATIIIKELIKKGYLKNLKGINFL